MMAPLITNRPSGESERIKTCRHQQGRVKWDLIDWGREILTGEDLEDGREKEATSLYESEELAEEDDEGDQAENGGENHERLHCLKPV